MKFKPLILVIITLIIGFFIGMLTSAKLRLHRLEPMRVFFSDEHFREGIYRTIQPDEKQKEQIEKILDKYARINGETQTRFWKELESNINAFRKELDSKLTKEQIARLRELDERRKEMIRHDRRKRRSDTTGFSRHGERYHRDNPSYKPGPRMGMDPSADPPVPAQPKYLHSDTSSCN
ncbi:MAG TPA: hypothetical protein PKL65_14755 [Bacteroidales bacterium]|jgi:hypothetical protein|nr:hypothetical protein [Bacteroidales bacterium]HNR43488.1 hypothetical protein [Bacteroidales bacterium]HQG76743.1 hypothetical protein [Bacteroidales bacterium]